MSGKSKRRTLLRGLGVTLGGITLGPRAVAGQQGVLSLETSITSDTPVSPGEEVTLAATVANRTDRPRQVYLDYPFVACCYYQGVCMMQAPQPALPGENIVTHSETKATVSTDRGIMWRWDEFPAGAERRVTVTFEVPDGVSGPSLSLEFGAVAPALCNQSERSPVVTAPIKLPVAPTAEEVPVDPKPDVTEDSPAVGVAPQSVAFGRTIAGTTETVPVTISGPSAGAVRVKALETPARVAVARDCTFGLWLLRYGCEPTPPFDVPPGGSKEVKLRLTAPLRGILTTIDDAATVQTSNGSTTVPITATSLADTGTVRDFERTAREFATFFGTSSDARLAAVGDDVVGMYKDIIQLVGKRAGHQYRDALEEAKEAGNKLQQAGEGLNTKQFITDWESSFKAPDASPQPGQLQADFLTIADTLSKCRAAIEADDLEAAVDHAQDVETTVRTVADELQAAYQEMRGGIARADAETYLGDLVAAVRAYATVVAGTESTTLYID